MVYKRSFGNSFIEIDDKARKNIPNIIDLNHELENHEIVFYNALAEMNLRGLIIPLDKKYSKPTNDISFAGKEWEVKTVKTRYKSISNAIKTVVKNAKKQDVIKENFIFDTSNFSFSEKLKRQLSEYNLRNPNNQIKNLLVFSKNKLIKIKLKK
ncbi:MAG: hypothetical protein LBT85_04155 [Bifidobacteriaceae bacterium]|jgi:hypothetical protein|nr:hypothetical protein [Bifidobacteriaceae bacterium]